MEQTVVVFLHLQARAIALQLKLQVHLLTRHRGFISLQRLFCLLQRLDGLLQSVNFFLPAFRGATDVGSITLDGAQLSLQARQASHGINTPCILKNAFDLLQRALEERVFTLATWSSSLRAVMS
jgi:hypothetical protein